MEAVIYSIEHIATGKLYIGSSVTPAARWQVHRSKLARGIHPSAEMQQLWTGGNGHQDFQFRVIETVEDAASLRAREKYWIDTLKPAFNTRQAAWGAVELSETHRERIANAHVGITPSDESRERMSASAKARPNLLPSRAGIPSWNKGLKFSDESRERMRQAHLGKRLTEEQKAKIRESCKKAFAAKRAAVAASSSG